MYDFIRYRDKMDSGDFYGDLVETDIPGAGHLTFVYARDPDGNIIELQHWG
ncbi:MAG: hypothetical protein Q8927_12755 [Bacteroidota bacterium]|nr:hypothetical protein [Bacteroidota bacterium]MDP4217063.1 hypothetical protein [Bacteroidota bacterium]MDP4244510.1 hypothetical protein [Bacteroidota bacterium]MDP4254603.1 hypothetical protein [Bacteroidota bacterium]MDP4258735.1 hypothetical protein [Bacteroidota bacterium]